MNYLQRMSRRLAPQWAPIPGTNQIRSSAGGFAWAVDEWTRLRRFLVLGSEGGSYYAGEWELTHENAEAVELCLAADGPRTVAEIVAVSEGGGAPKNDPAVYALAMAAGHADLATRRAALEALLDETPMTALVRNLATMTRVGVLTPGSAATAKAIAQLGDRERIRKARVHPIALLAALRTYAAGREVDVFVILTDNETWAGDIHPVQALAEYRRASGIDARLVTAGMVSNGFSIADPNDPGQLDVVGLDTASPQLIADFARGAL